MIVKDEEANLARALASVAGIFEQIVVVDTGSTDGTRTIAAQHGADVIDFPWVDDFSAARNASLKAARGNWIVVMDADEILRAEFVTRIKPRLMSDGRGGLAVRLRNMHPDGRLMGESQVLRIFHNHPDVHFTGRIHESVAASVEASGARITVLPDIVFDHFGYTKEEHLRKGKHQRNLSLLRLAQQERPADPSVWYHLGLQHYSVGDLDAARPLFQRVVTFHAGSTLAGTTASKLADLLCRQDRPGEAWRVAHDFANAVVGGVDCRFVVGRAALQAGDGTAAATVARALLADPTPIFGEIFVRQAQAEDLLARALWQQGAQDQALASLETALSGSAQDSDLAELWVRYFGLRFGADGLQQQAFGRLKGEQIVALVVARLMALGQRAVALALARRLAGHPAFQRFFGEMLFAAGLYAEAAAVFDRLPDCDEWRALCARKLGDGRAFNDRFVALDDIERPRHAGTWIDLLLRVGAFDAVQDLAPLVSAEPAEQCVVLARAADTVGLPDQALRWARRAPDAADVALVFARHSQDPAERAKAVKTLFRVGRAPVWLWCEEIQEATRRGDLQGARALRKDAAAFYPHATLPSLS